MTIYQSLLPRRIGDLEILESQCKLRHRLPRRIGDLEINQDAIECKGSLPRRIGDLEIAMMKAALH